MQRTRFCTAPCGGWACGQGRASASSQPWRGAVRPSLSGWLTAFSYSAQSLGTTTCRHLQGAKTARDGNGRPSCDLSFLVIKDILSAVA